MISSYKKTLLTLLSTPRNVVDGFVHGAGQNYMHPFKFLVIGVFFVVILNTLFVDFSFDPQPLNSEISVGSEQMVEIAEWIQVSNVRVATQFLPFSIVLIFIPSLAIGGLIFLREDLEGFYSNLILNSFAVGASVITLLAMIPIWMLIDAPLTDPIMNSAIPTMLVSGIMIWIYKQYLHTSSLLGWIRLISSYATGYIFYVILSGFFAGVIGYIFFVINRILELSGT